MSIVNVQRDGIYIEPDGPATAWPAQTNLVNNPVVNGPAAIHSDYGMARTGLASTITVGPGFASYIGVPFYSNSQDRMPFRVKASIFCDDPGLVHLTGLIVVGYPPASPTGTGDTWNGCMSIPFVNSFDDLVIVEPEPDGGTYAGRPIGIALAIAPNFALSTDACQGSLSVQYLGTVPPTMLNAVS